jgi:hypothetical protein
MKKAAVSAAAYGSRGIQDCFIIFYLDKPVHILPPGG